MIGIKISGRFGNQLFQYAFIRAASFYLGVRFFLVYPINEQIHLNKYFSGKTTRILFFARVRGRLVKLLNLYFKNISVEVNRDQPLLSELQDSMIYNGYFQTSAYFNIYSEVLKNEFKIKKKYVQKFNKKYNKLFTQNKTLVIHFRRSDYEKFYLPDLGESDFRLPKTYYLNCLKCIVDISDYKILVIGDYLDVDLSFLGMEFQTERNDFIIDFQLLQNADRLILSNSSFAWWGAFLNVKKNKEVFAPKHWIGYKQKTEYPKGIMTPKWNWINTDD